MDILTGLKTDVLNSVSLKGILFLAFLSYDWLPWFIQFLRCLYLIKEFNILNKKTEQFFEILGI